MSKKRNGMRAKAAKRPTLCDRCRELERKAARIVAGERPSYAHKAGNFDALREPVRPKLTPEEAFECAVRAGIWDRDGNLMPRYR